MLVIPDKGKAFVSYKYVDNVGNCGEFRKQLNLTRDKFANKI